VRPAPQHTAEEEFTLGFGFTVNVVVRETFHRLPDSLVAVGGVRLHVPVTPKRLLERKKGFEFGDPAEHGMILRENAHVGNTFVAFLYRKSP